MAKQEILNQTGDIVARLVIKKIAAKLEVITENNFLTDEEKVGHIRKLADNLKQGRIE